MCITLLHNPGVMWKLVIFFLSILIWFYCNPSPTIPSSARPTCKWSWMQVSQIGSALFCWSGMSVAEQLSGGSNGETEKYHLIKGTEPRGRRLKAAIWCPSHLWWIGSVTLKWKLLRGDLARERPLTSGWDQRYLSERQAAEPVTLTMKTYMPFFFILSAPTVLIRGPLHHNSSGRELGRASAV